MRRNGNATWLDITRLFIVIMHTIAFLRNYVLFSDKIIYFEHLHHMSCEIITTTMVTWYALQSLYVFWSNFENICDD